MKNEHLADRVQSITNSLIQELISLTPESMNVIQFEILSTPDGGADIGLIENHPDVKHVALSDAIYRDVSQYIPLIRQYISGWKRSLIEMRESTEGWKVSVEFESD